MIHTQKLQNYKISDVVNVMLRVELLQGVKRSWPVEKSLQLNYYENYSEMNEIKSVTSDPCFNFDLTY